MPLPTIAFSPARIPPDEAVRRLEEEFYIADRRRSVRMFSTDPIPREAIEWAIRVAGTGPSGAHKQPWFFVAISDPALKSKIREEAEIEEKEFYERRAPQEWLDALEPLGTDFHKTHITDAPWLIVVFRRDYEVGPNGERHKNYYMSESVGISVGFLIQALNHAGFVTLPHTPAPMTFLRRICNRPDNEKPFVVLPVGYPAADCHVPDIQRKPLAEISEFFV